MSGVTGRPRYEARALVSFLRVSGAEEWRYDAACEGFPRDWWYEPKEYRFARVVCEGCPVREECLEMALREEHSKEGALGASRRFGMRAGLTPTERARLAGAPESKRRQSTVAA